ncbi:MAG: hypothetical protein NC217_00925 [Muribaculaceae bacterium]|nr:hypothetical protein [Muribaculaceae bacterium]
MSTSDKIAAGVADGLAPYELLVNNIGGDKQLINSAVNDIVACDSSGQFCASAARFLHAMDPQAYITEIDSLLKALIDKDREKHYMPALLPAIWGDDYMIRADELRDMDDNFRRIFKRVHPAGVI